MSSFSEQDEAAYRELTRFRGAEPPGEAFELAIEKRIVSEYQQNLIGIAELSEAIDDEADTIQKLRTVRRRRRATAPGTRSSSVADHRADALVRLFAIEAAQDPDVMAFREDNLGSGLLHSGEMASWIEGIATDDGDPETWFFVPESALREGMDPDDPALNRLQGYMEYTPQLRYSAGGGRRTHAVPIRTDGVLGELRTISERISRRYHWNEAETTTFILTGHPPTPRGIRVAKVEPWPWPKARRRVAIDAPLHTTPDEVAERYRRVRDEMLGDEPVGRRSLTKRSADLAVFAAEHSSGHTWEEARAIWNRQHDKIDRYPDTARFTRASRTAYRRVTGEDLEWKGLKPQGTALSKQRKES